MARKRRVPVPWRRVGWVFFSALVLAGAGIIGCNAWVALTVAPQVYSDPEKVPVNDVGVVLGTSRKVAPNRPNLHFLTRMAAAAELYQSGKIQHILVSGAENSRYYNEPRDMQRELVARGVPASSITQDTSGFRTLDSMFRTSAVFGLTRYTVISDDFHVARAVFLGRFYGHEVVGFSAEGVSLRFSLKSRFREVFARVKAVLDVYLLRTAPRDLGEPQPIRMAAEIKSS